MSQTSEYAVGRVLEPERRLRRRRQVRAISYVKLNDGNGGIALDISETGLSVEAVSGLKDARLLSVRFQLPASQEWIEVAARVAWASESRTTAGLEFANLKEQDSRRIQGWLAQEAAWERVQRRHLPAPVEQQRAPLELVLPAAEPATVATTETEALATSPQNATTETETLATSPQNATAANPSAPSAGAKLAQGLSNGHRTERRATAQVVPAKKQPNKRLRLHGALIGLIVAFAVISLAAGWATGRRSIGWTSHAAPAASVRATATTQNPAAPAPPPPDYVVPGSEIAVANPAPQQDVTPAPAPAAEPETVRPAVVLRPSPRPQPLRPQSTPRRWAPGPASHPVQTVARTYPDVLSAPIPIGLSGGAEDLVISSAPVAAPVVFESAVPQVTAPAKQLTFALEQGALIHRVEPAYSRVAQEFGVGGTVKLHIIVGRNGAVRKVKVISGPPLLTRAAADAVRQWRYNPTLVNGKQVETERDVSLEFQVPQTPR